MQTLRPSLLLLFTILIILGCKPDSGQNSMTPQLSIEFNKTIQKHIDAIVARDLKSLRSTLSPSGKMTLIMQGTEIINSVDSFINFHEGWFQDTSWSMDSKIIKTEIGEKIGLAITESMYREPERNGKPYYNRMIVSYILERSEDKWFVINDHASSIRKSTDE